MIFLGLGVHSARRLLDWPKHQLRDCAAYCLSELPHFRAWLREVYVPQHLPKYLVDKYGKQAVRQIYTEINNLSDYVLEITEIRRMTSKEENLYRTFISSRQKLLGGF